MKRNYRPFFISLKTIEGHKNNLFLKTGAKKRIGSNCILPYSINNFLQAKNPCINTSAKKPPFYKYSIPYN